MLTIADPTSEMFTALRQLNDEQKAFIDELRIKANELLAFIDTNVPPCRRRSIAITHLEDVVMYATKAACFGS